MNRVANCTASFSKYLTLLSCKGARNGVLSGLLLVVRFWFLVWTYLFKTFN